MLAALTVVFATCSMVYELFLAQTLTSVLGGTNFRYALTIGLYITSMGFGALLLGPLGRWSHAVLGHSAESARPSSGGGTTLPLEALFLVELLLMVAGLLCIPYTLALDRMALWSGFGEAVAWTRTLLFHAPIVVIGVLSGLELPLLMRCAKHLKERQVLKTPPSGGAFDASTMAWDYVGTVLGAVLFPLVLLPRWGVFGVAALTVLGNAAATFVAVFFLGRHRTVRRRLVLASVSLSFALAAVFIFVERRRVEQVLVEQLYLLEFEP